MNTDLFTHACPYCGGDLTEADRTEHYLSCLRDASKRVQYLEGHPDDADRIALKKLARRINGCSGSTFPASHDDFLLVMRFVREKPASSDEQFGDALPKSD